MFRRTFLSQLFAVTAIVAGTAPVVRADSLGVASGYNLFVFTDLTRSYTDSEGRVAVGGNANLTGYGINNTQPGDGPGVNALVVGGNLSYNGGEVHYGDTKVGGAVSGSFGSPHGTVTSGLGTGGLPFSFSTAITDLTNKSAYWGGLASTGTVDTTPWGAKTLTGTGSGLNVFNVTGASLSGLTSLTIDAPAGSTVVVNVTGNPGTFSNYSMFLNGITRNDVLFNFVDATSLNVSGFSFKGSILAPFATLNHNNGNIEGTVIVNAVSAGNGEFHNYPFRGTPPPAPRGGGDPPPPPPPSAVPAPPGLVLGMIGAFEGWGLFSRRK